VEALSGSAEVTLLGDCDEVAQQAELHMPHVSIVPDIDTSPYRRQRLPSCA